MPRILGKKRNTYFRESFIDLSYGLISSSFLPNKSSFISFTACAIICKMNFRSGRISAKCVFVLLLSSLVMWHCAKNHSGGRIETKLGGQIGERGGRMKAGKNAHKSKLFISRPGQLLRYRTAPGLTSKLGKLVEKDLMGSSKKRKATPVDLSKKSRKSKEDNEPDSTTGKNGESLGGVRNEGKEKRGKAKVKKKRKEDKLSGELARAIQLSKESATTPSQPPAPRPRPRPNSRTPFRPRLRPNSPSSSGWDIGVAGSIDIEYHYPESSARDDGHSRFGSGVSSANDGNNNAVVYRTIVRVDRLDQQHHGSRRGDDSTSAAPARN